MTLEELLKLLVETEDQMERMNLVESNKEVWSGATTASVDNGEWETKYNELKKKYIDTFFGGTEPTKDESTKEDPKDEELERAESIKIDDLVK